MPPPTLQADLCLPWPLAMAKAARKPPLELAKSLAESLGGLAELESASASPPGFVNLKLSRAALNGNLVKIVSNPTDYGQDSAGPARAVPGDASGQGADQSTPSICAKICSSVKPCSSTALDGQVA